MDAQDSQLTPSALARQQRVVRRLRRDQPPWPWWPIDLLPVAGEGWTPATVRRFRPSRRGRNRLPPIATAPSLTTEGGGHDGAT
jgi:hypothetical protein